MTDKTDRMIAEAKMDKADELNAEIEELFSEIDRKLERMKELREEADELLTEE